MRWSWLRRNEQQGEALVRTQVEAVAQMEQEKRRYMAVQNTELRDRFESVESQNQVRLQTWGSNFADERATEA